MPTSNRRDREHGFTLIELMIVVAIIGIISALAIPAFMGLQLRSKTAEAKTNLSSIRTAQESYYAEHAGYVGAPADPPAPPHPPIPQKRPWQPSPGGFDRLGWEPEGKLYYVYAIAVAGGAYSVGATGELDGAPPTSDFAIVHPDTAGAAIAPPVGTGCVAAGVVTAGGGLALDTVGPCTVADGQNEF